MDSPIDPLFPDNQGTEMLNVDFDEHAPLGRKRGGVSSLSLAGGTAPSVLIDSLIRHVPAGNEAAAEFFLVDGASPPLLKRLAGGVAWADISVTDAIVLSPESGVVDVTFNGKLYLFYNSAVSRSHVWDGTNLRRVSFVDPQQAPTAANSGAGAYAAVLRYYRIRYVHLNGTLIVRRSEPSDSVSFTPSGAGASALITRPNAPGDGETHWEVEASLDNSNFYTIAGTGSTTPAVAIATTTFEDTLATSTYASNNISDPLGYHTPFPDFKFGLAVGSRMIMGGSHSGGLGSRVYHTPVLGSSNQGDDERLADLANRKPYTDLSEKDGGDLTGFGGPVDGVILAFKYRQIWIGMPTGDVDVPYRWDNLSRIVGSINHKSIVLAEDAGGRPAVYFLSYQGAYRFGVNGLQYMGRDIEDIWQGFNGYSGINLDATVTPSHGVYHADKKRIEWCISTGANNTPNAKIVLYVQQATRVDRYGVRGGWVYHTLDTPTRCSCMFSDSIGASMGRKLKPYLGRTDATVGKSDDDSDLDDMGTDFQAYIQTKSVMPPNQLGQNIGVQESILIAEPLTGVNVRQTLLYDFGLGTQTSDVLLTAEGAESHVIRKFEGGGNSDMGVVQIRLGDAVAQEGQWHLDALLLPVIEERDK